MHTMEASSFIDLVDSDAENVTALQEAAAPVKASKAKKRKVGRPPKLNKEAKTVSTVKGKRKPKAKAQVPVGTCVFACDVGLKNLAICVMEQRGDPKTGALHRPKIREWRNTNLYAERDGGKIIKFEAADKLILRIRDHLDDVGRSLNDWKDVTLAGIESQAASTNAIRRAESFIFAYFVYKHPHIQVKSIAANYKLKLPGMTHTKDETATYAQRKKMAIKYGREYMSRAPPDCPYKHFADKPARKKKGEEKSSELLKDDVFDASLMALHMLGLPITI